MLILHDEHLTFLSIVFYKGKFYQWTSEVSQIKNDKDFLLAADSALIAAKQIVDKLKERSAINRLRKFINAKIFVRFQRPQELLRTEDTGSSGS